MLDKKGEGEFFFPYFLRGRTQIFVRLPNDRKADQVKILWVFGLMRYIFWPFLCGTPKKWEEGMEIHSNTQQK